MVSCSFDLAWNVSCFCLATVGSRLHDVDEPGGMVQAGAIQHSVSARCTLTFSSVNDLPYRRTTLASDRACAPQFVYSDGVALGVPFQTAPSPD